MEKIDLSPWRVEHKTGLHLEEIDTRAPEIFPAEEDALAHQTKKLSDKLNKLQATLHASRRRALLLVLQGMDTAGKDGTIRHVFSHVSPLGVRAVADGRRKQEMTMTSWFAALIFAMLPIRLALPGAPPMGAWIDVLVTFWVFIVLMVALAWWVIVWLQGVKAKE